MQAKLTTYLFYFLVSVCFVTKAEKCYVEAKDSENANQIVATFKIKSIHLTADGMINWTTLNETGSLPFIIEQYQFDRWVKIGQVMGMGTVEANSYSYNIVYHAGINKFRVKQKGYDRIARYSEAVTFVSETEEINYKIVQSNRVVEFSNNTFFVLYNMYGDVLAQGFANSLDITYLDSGNYLLVYDNKLATFKKKKVLFKESPYFAMAF
ncbi:MAG: hypothetical protein J0M08_04685 [Bacteroidetes bacterium]|nr:hypothetical protein [Bacteroidota bacterium]